MSKKRPADSQSTVDADTQTNLLMMEFTIDRDPVCAYSHNGKTKIVRAGNQYNVLCSDSGQLIHTLETSGLPEMSLVYTPDDRWVTDLCSGRSWSTSEWKPLNRRPPTQHKGPVVRAAINSGKTTLATLDQTGLLICWKFGTSVPLAGVVIPNAAEVFFDIDDDLVHVDDTDRTRHTFNIQTGTVIKVSHYEKGSMGWLYAWNRTRTCCARQLEHLRREAPTLRLLPGYTDVYRRNATLIDGVNMEYPVSHDCNWLLSDTLKNSDGQRVIRLTGVRQKDVTRDIVLRDQTDEVMSVSFSTDGKYVVIKGRHSVTRVLIDGDVQEKISLTWAEISKISFSPNAAHYVTFVGDNKVACGGF